MRSNRLTWANFEDLMNQFGQYVQYGLKISDITKNFNIVPEEN